MKPQLILFATYWNEIEWINASLAQIDLINPDEIIICDGCFDPKLPNKSTDGTTEVIDEYVSTRDNATKISAVRLTKWRHALDIFSKLPHEKDYLSVAKLRLLKGIYVNNIYRLNQSATFNQMIKLSKLFKPGNWMMTYDCDQFYDDDMIDAFKNLKGRSGNILVGKELTFFEKFDRYTDGYEKRDYNNMPHKIFGDTRFIPTRHPSRVVKMKYMNCSDFEKSKEYVGNMFHYHIKSPERIVAGYQLGDRKPPENSRIKTKKFTGSHPKVIKKYFSL